MKIAFNRAIRRTPWGGGSQFLTAFADFLVANGHEVVHQLESGLDWIVMLDPRHEEGGFAVGDIFHYKNIDAHVRVLHRVNDTGVTRGGDELDRIILDSNQVVADHTVFISEWVRDHFVSKGYDTSRKHTVITNGCDASFFHPKSERDPHKPLRLVTHHWSDNVSKGLDLYRHIDKMIDIGAPIEFTYVGRYPKDYVVMARHTKIIAPLYGQALGDELRKHDVYVTAARYEACGSHHVEGAACGLPVIFHKDGGGIIEMCSRYGVEISNPGEFRNALMTIVSNYDSFRQRVEAVDLTAETMCQKYLDILAKI